MGLDIVRQPLVVAFATLIAFAVAAMVFVGGPLLTPGDLSEPVSLLGGYIEQAQLMWPIVSKVVCGVLIFVCGALLGRITIRYGLYGTHSHLAMPVFGCLAAGLFVSDSYLIEYLSLLLFILSIRDLYLCQRNGTYAFNEIFRASLYLGLIPLIYTPALILAINIPLAILIFRHSSRELLVAIVGYILPFLLVCYLNWVLGGSFVLSFVVVWDTLTSSSGFMIWTLAPLTLSLLGLLGFLFLGASMSYLSDLYAAGSKSRSILHCSLLFFLVASAMLFLPCSSPIAAIFIAVPGAIVLPLFFVRLNHWVAVLLYLGLIGLSVLHILL